MVYHWVARLTAVAAILLAPLPASPASASSTGNWPGYLFSPARTSYNSAERIITPVTAPGLTQVWHTSQGPVSTEPAESGGVVYYGSWDGYERAVSANTGAQLWATYLGQTTDTGCNPPTVGVASTATVHNIMLNGVSTTAVFVGGGDGYFYALNAATGAVIWKTSLGSSPSHFLWSSPLFWRGGIYEGIASFGDCPLVRGGSGSWARPQARSGIASGPCHQAAPALTCGAHLRVTPPPEISSSVPGMEAPAVAVSRYRWH